MHAPCLSVVEKAGRDDVHDTLREADRRPIGVHDHDATR